jgi:PAS domain S-box-containing protein
MVEDSADDAELVARQLRRGGWEPEIRRVETADAMEAALAEARWDVVLADYALPQFSGPAALALLRRAGLDLPFIIVTGAITEDTAVAAMRAGAHDYVMKDNLRRLGPAIQRELREAAERRQLAGAEALLARERDYSRALIEESSALIVGLDADARITLFNRAAETATGYRREDVLGRSWFERIVPRERFPDVWDVFQTFGHTGGPADYENPIVTAAGVERIIAWRNSTVRTGDGLSSVLSFGIDVTERRRAEEARVMLEQAARQAERLAALGTLAAGLAHELNNPIGIMSSRIELILLDAQRTGLPPEVAEDLQVIHRHAGRVARIAQGLLSFARNTPGQRTAVDLNVLVQDAVMLAGKSLTREGIEIDTALDPDLPLVPGDPTGLQQVILNLVVNARDAIEGTGRIAIETARVSGPPRGIRLSVADTGRGIAPDDLARIFDPFFTTKPRGTGLGLSITHGIVRDHGATIDVESAAGRGTRFVVTFPVD